MKSSTNNEGMFILRTVGKKKKEKKKRMATTCNIALEQNNSPSNQDG